MFKDDAILMFENYWQLIDHLKEKKDDKGLKILAVAIKSSETLIFGLIGVINELALNNDKELFIKPEEEVKKWDTLLELAIRVTVQECYKRLYTKIDK